MDASLHTRTYTWPIIGAWLLRDTNGTMANALQHKSTEPWSTQVGYSMSSKGSPDTNSSLLYPKAIILNLKSQTQKGMCCVASVHMKSSWRTLTCHGNRLEIWASLGWRCEYWCIREGSKGSFCYGNPMCILFVGFVSGYVDVCTF